jgi:hypothetical protein|tara:strand:+ start:141 stop:323 length:183 start_codon:yes stop_codon:yes gene_type:complete
MSKDFVDSISTGDNLGAETAFNVAMAAKVGDTLEIKRKEVSKTFVKTNNTDQEADVNETD